MAVTSVTGHVMETDFRPEVSKKWHACEPSALLDLQVPVIKFVRPDAKDIEANLKQEAQRASWLILWLDCDREGENIAFEVIDICKSANPRLQVFRAHFSALIPRDIHRAIQNLTPPDEYASMAVDTRQELDLRIGAAFTRFQTLRLKAKFQGLQQLRAISYGPCQFPTLGFVVERYWEITSFIAEKFWTINCTISKDDQQCHPNWRRRRFFDRLSCLIIYEMVVEEPMATVVSVVKKPTRKFRPFPLTTVALQKLASRKLKFGSHHTMTVAEALYNNGFLSYPRTETDSFVEGTDLLGLIGIHTSDPNWGDYAQQLINGKFKTPKKGKHNDNSHPPIHPVKYTPLSAIRDNDQRKLYELVTRHFLACCSEDAIGSETVIEFDISGEIFVAKGLIVEQLNYLQIYPYDRWVDKALPDFYQGEKIMPTALEMHEGETTAPPPLTEAELIRKMDENGIGTDATIATHIQTIQDRGYAVKNPTGEFIPTTLGLALVDAYNSIPLEFKLSAPQLRAKMEKDMNSITQRQATKDQVVRINLELYKKLFLGVVKEAAKLDAVQACSKYFDPLGTAYDSEEKNFSTCGKCSGMMNLRNLERGKVLFCEQCNESLSVPHSGNLKPIDHICPICKYQVLSVEKQTTYNICPWCYNHPPNQQGNGQGNFPCFTCSEQSCPLAKKVSDQPVRPCPKCGMAMTIRKKKDSNGFFLGCTGFPNCKSVLSLPEAEAITVSDPCPECSTPTATIRMLEFKFNRSQVSYAMPLEYVACISGCNETLKDMLRLVNRGNLAEYFNPIRLDASVQNNTNGGKRTASGSIVSSYERLSSGLASSSNTNLTLSNVTNVTRNQSRDRGFEEEDDEFTPVSRKKAKTSQYENWSRQEQSQQSSSKTKARMPPASASGAFGNSAFSNEAVEVPFCGCQRPAVLRTSNSAANPGRQFFTCSLPREEQCGIFVWVDEWDGNPNPQIRKKGEPAGSGSGYGSTNGYSSDTTCYSCGQSGHFASQCPQGRSGQPARQGAGSLNSTNSSVSCYKCGQPGHFANNCSQNGGNSRSWSGKTGGAKRVRAGRGQAVKGERSTRKCGNCGEPGHTRRNCPANGDE